MLNPGNRPVAARKPKNEEQQAAETVVTASMKEAMEDYDRYVQNNAVSIWEYTDTGHDLDPEEQLFVRSYIIDRNPVAALKRIGQNASVQTLKQRAQKMLANPEVGNAIDYLAKQMMARLEITAERVQRRIAAVAFFDIRQVAHFDTLGMRLLDSRFWSEDQAAAVQSIKMGNNGIEIKLYDGLRAAELLSKQIGLQPDETDAAQAARIAADEAMVRIGQVIDRMYDPTIPVDVEEAEPEPDSDAMKRLN